MRLTLPTLVLLATCAPALVQAQAPAAPPPPTASPAATPADADPVIAKVGDQEIHRSDLADAAKSLPEQMQGMPQQMLYPILLDQLIDRRALVMQAHKQGLDRDPQVQRSIQRAADTTLQNALLQREVTPSINDEAVRARYDRDIAGKPGEEEAHAAHILVADEALAKDIIAQLKAGGDFTALAKKYSTDPSAQQGGGDLGWFKKGDMLPEFSDAAFALKPGETTQVPVKTRFGWHVIHLEAKRTAPPPSFEEAREGIRQELIQDGVKKALEQARQGLTIVRFNPDGTVPRAPDAAAPAAAPAPAASPAAPPAKR
jgi:peptidyl-prolyl cis-trans isomerase C